MAILSIVARRPDISRLWRCNELLNDHQGRSEPNDHPRGIAAAVNKNKTAILRTSVNIAHDAFQVSPARKQPHR
jgi:hypothetical protein